MMEAPAVRLPLTRPRPVQTAIFVIALAGVSWTLGWFSALAWWSGDPAHASLRISLKRVTAPVTAVVAPSPGELAKIPAHMRPRDPARTSTGRRADAVLSVEIDGRTVLTRTYRPTGLRHDGPVYGYEQLALRPGTHRLTVRLAEVGGAAPHTLTREVDVRPGRAPLIEYVGAGWYDHLTDLSH